VLRLLLTVSTVAAIVAWSTTADAKKAKPKLKMDPTVEPTPEPTGPVPPEADANGHVNFGNPQAEGIGRVSVKSETGDKIQVYLDGRYFGDTPVTIYSVPKGDYIVEGTIVSSGKQVTKPVSVSENEEATVDLGSSKPDTPVVSSGGGSFTLGGGDISPRRLQVAKVCLIGGGVFLLGGVTFAILESSAESDYEKASPFNTSNLDAIQARGKRYALLANLGFALAGVAVVGAAIAAYPMFVKSNAEKAPDAKVTTTAYVAPIISPTMAGGAMMMTF